MKLAKAKQKKVSARKSHNIIAEKSLKKLKVQDLREKFSKSKKPVFIVFDNEQFEIPESERQQFIEALIETADLKLAQKEGNILSTQEVANLLNVSRPYVVKLIETKQLKSFKVGAHRRVLEVEALEYRKKMRNEQNTALDELAEETEKLGVEFK